ncbi:MAG: hypothetical protein QM535_21205 [Limnohabitans sp.]|nr:hypothetical protein [Limnohabitans sp.]
MKSSLLKHLFKLFLLLFILNSIFIFLTSCKQVEKTKEKKISHNLNNKEIEFKIWLKDTLKTIKKGSSDSLKREIKIEKDSLSLELIKSYNLTLSKNYNGNDKEIVYALDLLNRNNIMPQNQFHLDYTIQYYFYVSPVEQLKKDFDTEIQKFIVRYKNENIEYKFIKGNLISSKNIKP